MILLLLFQILLVCEVALLQKTNNDIPTLSGVEVDRNAVFDRPLTQGVYNFTPDGHIPAEPLTRIRKIHKEMIHVIQTIPDHKKQVSYLLTLSNTAHEDIKKLRRKIIDAQVQKGGDWKSPDVKADAFLLIASHGALLSNAVLYFPDIMNIIMKKNPEFAAHVKWIIQFCSDMDVIGDPTLLKLFHLAKQEIGIIPREPDYQNPYKGQTVVVEQPSTTTKKPKKKLRRGPRLSGSEL